MHSLCSLYTVVIWDPCYHWSCLHAVVVPIKRPSRGHSLFKVKASLHFCRAVIEIDQRSFSLQYVHKIVMCESVRIIITSPSSFSLSHISFSGFPLLKSTIENRHQQRYCEGKKRVGFMCCLVLLSSQLLTPHISSTSASRYLFKNLSTCLHLNSVIFSLFIIFLP